LSFETEGLDATKGQIKKDEQLGTIRQTLKYEVRMVVFTMKSEHACSAEVSMNWVATSISIFNIASITFEGDGSAESICFTSSRT